jgi:hypothetical protein
LFLGNRTAVSRSPAPNNVVPLRPPQERPQSDDLHRNEDDEELATQGSRRLPLLTEEELRAIEAQYATGLTAVQVIEVFTNRGIKLSEASFRKYVQQGLLPRSRRVGRKGKHRGSLGIYPAKTIRRINSVKQLMADGHTIEEIQGHLLAYTDLLETVAESLDRLWSRLDGDVGRTDSRELDKEFGELRRDGDRLIDRAELLTQRVAAPRADNLRLAGAAGSAEDLF